MKFIFQLRVSADKTIESFATDRGDYRREMSLPKQDGNIEGQRHSSGPVDERAAGRRNGELICFLLSIQCLLKYSNNVHFT